MIEKFQNAFEIPKAEPMNPEDEDKENLYSQDTIRFTIKNIPMKFTKFFRMISTLKIKEKSLEFSWLQIVK
ncbi:TPA: hypothetical protein U1212_001384 [Streptococcus suis]|nr:hypothetical protein [Streptococcus suis]